ncbi:unnamed protein product [Spirodela intermedia]|uniref:Uncharacterized protein n=1 Tax=Spirodela intermedia TaxID=51605 RepID=A0A7I8JKA5_SPIIN|nr:unnamed protein product [Spirodela intermedia]CAA6670281.1 unnamed protein product [Spirodela intermedia]
MPSRSCVDLFDLVDLPSPTRPLTPRLPRVMAFPGIISDFGDGDPSSGGGAGGSCGSPLPLRALREPSTRRWQFSWDQDALSLQLHAGFPQGTEVVHVGTLHPPDTDADAAVDPAEREEVSQILYDQFRCVPVFLPPEVHNRFYHGFCKHYLWPLGGVHFDRCLWQAYVSANKAFADTVTEVLNPDEDYVWVHDYHLMALPTFLRRRSHRVKIGFFLHSPFPSSEIYRTLPVRDEILRALLNSDLIGFHTFDYARHFLSCCSRMLGIDYESKRGYIGLEYYGRTVSIKILPVGVDMGLLERVKELSEQYKNRTLLLGVDDMDSFKGISLKFLAMGQLLEEHQEWRGRAVLVQIANPARSKGKDVQEVHDEMREVAEKINGRFGTPGYEPIVIIDRPVLTYEKLAYYAISECCVVNPVRDGMNLVPYKYTVCRQGTPALMHSPKKSMIVVSEFIGCSPSLSGAIRVNPWNVDAVADALNLAIKMPEAEKQMRHEKHFKYISSHDVAYWARSFDQDLQRSCKEHFLKRCWGIGFGLGFRVVALGPHFRKLCVEHIVSAYRTSSSRLILLDYDGTIMPMLRLCSDPKNVVFVVSGRDKDCLSKWFCPVEKLGISAEHGYYTRWSADSPWKKCSLSVDFNWKKIAEPVMKLYMETTDGSSIEHKESALVWHHQDADPDFGSCQAKELLDHLENVLANEPVVVKRGQHIVEVKPQSTVICRESARGWRRRSHLHNVNGGRSPDFILCVGDDRSDEDMFEKISSSSGVFACTVGRKPSKAKYYLDDPADVVRMLQGLATSTGAATRPPKPAASPPSPSSDDLTGGAAAQYIHIYPAAARLRKTWRVKVGEICLGIEVSGL